MGSGSRNITQAPKSISGAAQPQNLTIAATLEDKRAFKTIKRAVTLLDNFPNTTGMLQGGPKVVTQTFGLIAQRLVAHYNSHLVNTMLLSTIRGPNSRK